ncbi:protein tyrosine kinase [Trichuris suis]|nr:protein tyrosine kinase [Trichuris suis]
MVKLEDMEFSTVDQLVRYYVKTRKPLVHDMEIIISKPVHRAHWVLYNDQIELITKLGEGNYGEVWKGVCYKRTEGKKTKKEVAVKFFKNLEVVSEEEKDFFGECRKQKQLSHLHIVKFIGIVINSERPKLVMELCDTNLLRHLKTARHPISLSEKFCFALQIVYGMEYLVQESIIHRDLAARNCLIKKDILKISDFGMARSGKIFQAVDRNVMLPIKWTAPEALIGIFSEKTDVWAFGITLWELFSNGKSPYADLETKYKENFPVELVKFLMDGKRLSSPSYTPPDAYDLMLQCWDKNSNNRPTFTQIRGTVEVMYAASGGMLSCRETDEEQYDDDDDFH